MALHFISYGDRSTVKSEALMLEEIQVKCPYCGEHINSLVDCSAGDQTYYEDCRVCCQPIVFIIEFDIVQNVTVSIKRDDD